MFLTETQYKKVLLWTTLIGVMFNSLKGVEIKFVSLVVEIVFRCIVYSFFSCGQFVPVLGPTVSYGNTMINKADYL